MCVCVVCVCVCVCVCVGWLVDIRDVLNVCMTSNAVRASIHAVSHTTPKPLVYTQTDRQIDTMPINAEREYARHAGRQRVRERDRESLCTAHKDGPTHPHGPHPHAHTNISHALTDTTTTHGVSVLPCSSSSLSLALSATEILSILSVLVVPCRTTQCKSASHQTASHAHLSV